MTPDRLLAEYVLPLRWFDDSELDELTTYLATLSTWIDVTVVDGSPAAIFGNHARAWSALVRHCAPESWVGANGKVKGVMTGLRYARHERVVIADDDVRYDAVTLGAIVAALGEWHLVRPQNYFASLPWHARWDTARTLVNRAFGSDLPGTLAVRRDIVLAAGGYRGDVLFENLELIRTVRAMGGRELRADDLFVARMPPSVHHFLHQRVRQAYDDFAQPLRLMAELSLLPLAIWGARRPARLLTGALLGCILAECGRWRGRGTTVFGKTSALWAPLWLSERAVCVWLALSARLLCGGVRYGDGRLSRSATPQRTLVKMLHTRKMKEQS